MGSNTYTVNELAELSGVSVRTLHYYDEIGLLHPIRRENNYRNYGVAEVNRLQQILLYRKGGVSLKDIKKLLDDSSFDAQDALMAHLDRLKDQQQQIAKLIESVERTLKNMEEEVPMEDKEKFEGFKRDLIEENEAKYGKEIREKYGDDQVDASNAKLAGLSEDQWKQAQELEQKLKDNLREAMDTTKDPASPLAQEACDLHRQWLNFFWKEGMYSKEAHLGLAEGYVADERFKEYYEQIAPGATEFLRDAMKIYCA